MKDISLHSDPPGPLPPETVVDGRYRIVGDLGEGGFAHIYRAVQLNIEREVALKVVHSGKQESSAFHQRFEREARIAAALRHPNIVTIHDFGFEHGCPYLVMELLKGHDLHEELVGSGPMQARRVLPLFIELLDGLGVAHASGAIHKDLKPLNLFVVAPNSPKEQLVIMDFGVAHLETEGQGRLTAAGEIAGTPRYLAPEYIADGVVSPRLDVYQAALILVEMFTGVPVVNHDSAIQCLTAHCAGELNIPDEIRNSPLGPVVARALSTDPALRYAHGHAFRDALCEVCDASVEALPQTLEAADRFARLDKHKRRTIRGSGPLPGHVPALDRIEFDPTAEFVRTPAEATNEGGHSLITARDNPVVDEEPAQTPTVARLAAALESTPSAPVAPQEAAGDSPWVSSALASGDISERNGRSAIVKKSATIQSSRMPWMLGVALLLVGAGLWIAFAESDHSPSSKAQSEDADTSPAATSPPTTPASHTVELPSLPIGAVLHRIALVPGRKLGLSVGSTNTVDVFVASTPAKATITLGDVVLGKTPKRIKVPRTGATPLTISLDGFYAETRQIESGEADLVVDVRLRPLDPGRKAGQPDGVTNNTEQSDVQGEPSSEEPDPGRDGMRFAP